MDTQQMMELLLAMKEDSKTQRERMETYQAKLDADREELMARLDKNAKTMNEKMDANTKATLATKEDRKIDKEEMIQEMRADQEQRKTEMEERMTVTQAKTEGELKEPREEMMQSAEEHHEVPREDAVVIPVRGWKRQHRGRKEAAGRHGEPMELN
jgi:hypothetical protein